MSVQCSLGHDNPDGSAFCDECGEPLSAAAPAPAAQSPAPAAQAAPGNQASPAGTQTCSSCGAENPAGEAFCSNCGVSLLGAPAPVAQAPAAVSAAPESNTAAQAAPQSTGSAVAAPSALQARLIVEADNQEFDLSGKENITIGREDAVSNIYPDVDLTPHAGEEGGVSRLHARIFVDNGQYMLEDENSTNFTFLNRQRLAGKTPTPLHDNDEVRLGRVLLRFKTA
ncbi:FHA domain-containing protein [Dictyobacter arantiisoli]|uniref:FHA domain-containing protein n=1 Tax=Dictyobacter arantiisoli TaxID=2014874 RepID=A0A5A5T5H0_9CHLR|nr:FHA domain-containing protein [Dictyobacter arantiisoli]GCF06558.1 hypothetical protein KDI_01220 [Dictyobacter arantiisoli]